MRRTFPPRRGTEGLLRRCDQSREIGSRESEGQPIPSVADPRAFSPNSGHWSSFTTPSCATWRAVTVAAVHQLPRPRLLVRRKQRNRFLDFHPSHHSELAVERIQRFPHQHSQRRTRTRARQVGRTRLGPHRRKRMLVPLAIADEVAIARRGFVFVQAGDFYEWCQWWSL